MPKPPNRQKLSNPYPITCTWGRSLRSCALVVPSDSGPSVVPDSRPDGFGQPSVPLIATSAVGLVAGDPGPVAFDAVTVHVSGLVESAIWTVYALGVAPAIGV